jgi:hypothetical protein
MEICPELPRISLDLLTMLTMGPMLFLQAADAAFTAALMVTYRFPRGPLHQIETLEATASVTW